MQSQPNSSNTPNSVATRFSSSENVSLTTMSVREMAGRIVKRHPAAKRDIKNQFTDDKALRGAA